MAIIGTAPNQTFQRTDGTRTGAAICQQEKTAGANNTAVLADARENDISSALNVMLMKTGGNTPTGNMPMGGFKHTGVGAATGAGQYAEYDQMGDADDVILEAAKDYADTLLEEGTVCVFYQAAAPTGWTKATTHNDKTIRIVSGTGGGSGGSTAFTTVFAMKTPAGTVGAHTLTVDETPTHYHFEFADENANSRDNFVSATQQSRATSSWGGDEDSKYQITGTSTAATRGKTSSTGGGGSHDHTFTGSSMDFRVTYVDCILASRDAAVH